MSASTPIEFGDELAGRREHDRVESCRSVNNPSVKGIRSGFGEVTDMDASVIEVEVERRRVTFAEGERCGCLVRVGEPMQLGQVEGAVALMSRRTPPEPIAASC